MKTCSKCNHPKEDAEFSFRHKSLGIRLNICKSCVKKKNGKYYKKNTAKFKSQAKNNRRRYYSENQRMVLEYLSSHPCVDCGEDNLIVLQFDHVRGEKVAAVGKMMPRRMWKDVEAEIEKCDVRCANCHLIRHANKSNWIRLAVQNKLNGESSCTIQQTQCPVILIQPSLL